MDDKNFISNRLKGTGYRGSEKDLWRVIIKEKSRNSDEPQEEFQYLANALLKAVDILEDNLSAYINGFNGNESLCGTRVRQLYLYFQPEEYYAQSDLKTSENADKLFWERYIGIATPEIFDNPNKASKKPIVQYFFGGIDGLLDFINKAKSESMGENEEDVINRILSNCPDKYSAAYRLYMATGEKLPLNED